MTSIRVSATLAAAAVLAVAAMPQAQVPGQVTLTVPGHTNATPWIASDGRAVAVVWGATADGKSDIYVATSDDEGATFGPPVRVNTVAGDGRVSGEIPPRVALHRPAGAARPDVVVAWNAKDQGTEVKIARSRDGGRTFGKPASLQASGAAGDRGWHALTIDAQGTAHVVWLDHRGLAEAKAASSGGGAAPMDHHAEHDGVAMAQKSRLVYATLGATAAPEQMVTPGVCYCCKTALVPTSRGVVAAWRHVYAGNMRDIAFAWLGRPGAAASAPARVNEDGWAINGCPDDGPAMAVGARDAVHIVWPTVIPGPEPMGALFHAAMADGVRFGARQRVPTLGAPKPSHPQVAVDGAGRLFVAWDEMRSGVRTAAMVDATPTADGGLRFGAPAPIAPGGPTLYPVMAPLARGVVVAWTSGAPGASTIVVQRRQASAAQGTAAP